MASPGDLYNVIAPLLGVSPATVRAHDLALVRAGLRTSGGRGRSAAKMTSRDAASLTIVTMASNSLRDTVATFNDFAGLQTKKRWSLVGQDSPIQALGERHTFLEAFTAIIDGVRSDRIEIAQHPRGEIRTRRHFGENPIDIRISLYMPHCYASISFLGPKDTIIERRGYTGGGDRSGSETINMERTYTIDDRTLYALSCRLNDRELKTEEELRKEMMTARKNARPPNDGASTDEDGGG
jgi:hypothetical protein